MIFIDSRLPTRRPLATEVSTKGGSRGTTKMPMTHFAHRTNSRRLETAMAIFSWYDLSWKVQRDVVRPARRGRRHSDAKVAGVAGEWAKGKQKSTVAIEHTKLPDRETAQRLKVDWTARLDALAEVLAKA